MKSFFNEPDHFSFKDVLAVAFAGAFLFFSYRALSSRDALALVQTLVPLLAIILGGYFAQEGVAQWLNRTNNSVNGNTQNNQVDPMPNPAPNLGDTTRREGK